MMRIIRHPAVNAAGLGALTALYAALFLSAGERLYPSPLVGDGTFWARWSEFLASGGGAWIALPLSALTIAVIALLLRRKRPYDEYHASRLILCLAVAAILTLACIAIFYCALLADPTRPVEKFTLFIAVHWATVVLCDLAYVLLSR